MTVNFIYKRCIYYVGLALVFLSDVFSFFYAVVLSRVSVYTIDKAFYFLVLEDTKLEVASYEVKLDGGAGFLLNHENRDYVALSVYLSGEEGNKVYESILRKYENAKIVKINSGKLYMKRDSEKKLAKKIQGGFNSLYGCIEVLEREISRLDKGATQQSSGRILSKIADNLLYLSKKYKNDFKEFSNVCKNSANALNKSVSGIIYAKELRHILCETCANFIKLSQEFPL